MTDLSNVQSRIDWVKRLHIFLDSSCSNPQDFPKRTFQFGTVDILHELEIELEPFNWDEGSNLFFQIVASRKSEYHVSRDSFDFSKLDALLQLYESTPSAGGLRSVSLYCVIPRSLTAENGTLSINVPSGSYQILSGDGKRRIKLIKSFNLADTESLMSALQQPEFFERFPMVIFAVGNLRKMFEKYSIKNYQMLFADAGIAIYSLQIGCSALKLGGVPVGGINSEPISKLLQLNTDMLPLMAFPVGNLHH